MLILAASIRRRFEQNQTDCTMTALALLPTLTENVLEQLPVEQLTNELQQKKAERLARASEGRSEASSMQDGDTVSLASFQTGSFVHASQFQTDPSQPTSRRTKAQLWNELKINSITRAFTLIYSLSLLIILTRIQLNLLGRLNYLSSVLSLAHPPPPGRANSISLEDHDNDNAAGGFGNDFETNRRYLTFSWYLLHRGYGQILIKVRAAVEEVFGSVSPNEGVSAARLSDLVLSVRKLVEGNTEHERYATRWLPYILPPKEEEEAVLIESGVITPPPSSPNPSSPLGQHSQSHPTSQLNASTEPLRQLLDETADLIDSPTFTRIHTLLLGSMFSHLVDGHIIAQAFPQHQPHSPSSSVSGSQHPRIQELDSAVTVVPGEPRVKLASLLAVITRQARVIGQVQVVDKIPQNEYVDRAEAEVRELEAFAAVIYASNIEQSIEGQQRQRQERPTEDSIKSASGIGVSEIGTQPVDDLIESKLESAWTKLSGSTSIPSR